MERLTDKSEYCEWCDFDKNTCKMYKNCYERKIVSKLREYEDLEEQGLLLRLPVVVIDVVDKLFSHNEIVNLWIERKNEISYHELVWSGMAWDIPEVLKNCNFIKIFGTIPMAISEADHINIEIALTEEAEAALEKMKGEEHETD